MIRKYSRTLPVLLLCMMTKNASSHDIAVPNADGVMVYYNYTNNNANLAVTYAGDWYGAYQNEYSGVVAIPEEVTVGERTLQVTSIDNSAFSGCYDLTTVTIPDNVTTIGSYAFGECRNLLSVNIPDGVTSIEDYTFDYCSCLTQITIPNGVTSIGEHAFDGCSALTSISIPNGVTNIGTNAFAGCYSLTSADIPNSVTTIGDYTFAYCYNLTSITIGNSVASIGNFAFAVCSSLTSVTIPNSVTTIGDYAFMNCSRLTSIDIGNGVTSIGNDAFWECTSLPSVTIGNSVTSIGNSAFYGCSSLESITIPKSVTHIGYDVFGYCYNFNVVHITDLEAWCNIQFDGNLFKTYHLYLNGEEIKNLIIPDGVTSIGSYAFAKCYRLLSIIIPEGVTSIGHNAFAWCSNLQNIYCYAEQVPKTGDNVFEYSNYTNAILHVPAASVSAYQAAEQWKDFGNIVALPAQADVYRPFVEDDKVWKVGGTESGNPVQRIEYYYFDGDTIIDGKTCKQMMCLRYVNPEHPDYAVFSQYPSLSYVGAWYEEDKKVYVHNGINNQFKLMYDFSLDANDTLQFNKNYSSYVVRPKQTGGIKGFKGVYRDIIIIIEEGLEAYNTTWLEGVGGIDGPTVNVYYGKEGHALFLMSCTVGDEVIYLNDEYEDGATPGDYDTPKQHFDFTHTIKTRPKAPIKREKNDACISSSEREVVRPKVNVPRRREAEQSLYGEYNDQRLGINLYPIDEAYLVSITDETGKTVYEKAIDAGNIVGLDIDISSYPKGLYTVTVENSQEVFTGEFETQTTGIEEVRSQKSEVRGYIYNLQGQRLSTLQKGLNIVNGKKVYIK